MFTNFILSLQYVLRSHLTVKVLPSHLEWNALTTKEAVADKELPKMHKFVAKNLTEIVAALVKYQQIVRNVLVMLTRVGDYS